MCDSTHQEKFILSIPMPVEILVHISEQQQKKKSESFSKVLLVVLWDTMNDSSELVFQTVKNKAKEQQSYFIVRISDKRFL